MGLKSVDTFEELNLNPDLLRGIYGNFFIIQLSVSKSHLLFNKRVFSQLLVKETLLLKLNQEQEKPPLSLSVFSNWLILSHLNVKQSFWLQQDN